MWATEIRQQSKLHFYSKIKKEFCYEPYLNTSISKRKNTAQLRSSSHKLNVETSRYNSSADYQKRVLDKRCLFCSGDEENLQILAELPFFDAIAEDELHLLRSCPKYDHIRIGLSDPLKILLLNEDYTEGIFHQNHSREMNRYVNNLFNIRFPKDKKL